MPDIPRDTSRPDLEHHESGVPLIAVVLSGALSVGQLAPLEETARPREMSLK